MKKIMLIIEKKILLKCIEMQDLHAIFFNWSDFLNYFYNVTLGKKFRMKLKFFHYHIYEKDITN
jgi:hypothetical protein